jgi:hypothetical protein
MFPSGAPGVALLILRFSLAAAILDAGPDYMRPLGIVAVTLVLAAQSILLCLGLLTPVVSTAAGVFELTDFLIAGHTDGRFLILSSLNAAAIGLLGPGAYSLDARLFGRRETVLHSGQKPRRR